MLEEFDVRIEYVKGEQNGAADALSRHPDFGAIICPVDVAPELQWEASYKAEMPEEVQEDEHGNLIPVDSEEIWHGDRLWRANRIVVPPSQVKSVLDQCHRLCGHGCEANHRFGGEKV